MPTILLVPIGIRSEELPPLLLDSMRRIFQCPVEIERKSNIDSEPAFNPARNQYLSNRLLFSLLEHNPQFNGKILGITPFDLFAPVLTYVFGEAQLHGKVAVVSTYRLNEKLYGLPENRALMEERLLKEAVHELGHTFGLIHCPIFECVMHSSTAVEELDLKNHDFCPVCSIKLRTGEVSTS